jgi:hypothetical protein
MSARTPWLEALAPRAGPLLPNAREAAHTLGGIERGANGLRQLADHIDRWAEREVDEAADHRFVEGAGALLGLLLLDELGGAGHRSQETLHRVALGRFGFFDPFAAVEAALEADSPRHELARRVSEAEREARGEGAVSRVVSVFATVLESHRPGRSMASQFELTLRLDDGTEVDLSSVARATHDQSATAVRPAVEKLVAMLPGGDLEAGLPWSEASSRILPRLVGPAFLSELSREARDALFCVPFVGDVNLTLILDYRDRARYVRRDELDRWEVTPSDARAHALANLAGRSERARFARVDTDGGAFVVARSGDGLDAARLLLPGLHEVLAAELASPMLVAIPHRDALIAASGTNADALAARARDDAARAPHTITADLFEVTASGVRPAS